jgi:hypothetical protein
MAFGDADQFDADVLFRGAPIAGIVALPHRRGLWAAGCDGGVFSFGAAPFHGSLTGQTLNAPVTAIAATDDGDGYLLVGADGGVFTFGTARFRGALKAGSSPVVGVALTPHSDGYWLAQADGTVTAFGAAPDFGGLHDVLLTAPVVAIASPPPSDRVASLP